MRAYYLFIVFVAIAGCRKQDLLPRLRFTTGEREWFIYEVGQQFKFKNSTGDSLVYNVTTVEHKYDRPEYKDTSLSKVVALTETYLAKLKSDSDSIIIYFYKELVFLADPTKMRQTISWITAKNQFVELLAIRDHAPFTSRTVNGVLYTRVTQALPPTQAVYPMTKYDYAYYDQKAGFIEIIDLNGNAWKRQ